MENMRLLVTGGSGFIGTNLMANFIAKGVELINLDWNPPLNPEHAPYWKPCDIMDEKREDYRDWLADQEDEDE